MMKVNPKMLLTYIRLASISIVMFSHLDSSDLCGNFNCEDRGVGEKWESKEV